MNVIKIKHLFLLLLGFVCFSTAPVVILPTRNAAAAAWSVVPMIEETSSAAVWCESSVFCVSVGRMTDLAHHNWGNARSWNGSYWSSIPTVSPQEATASQLSAISCQSTVKITIKIACLSVGHYANGPNRLLVEKLTNSSALIQKAPEPKEARSSELEGVSCVSSNFCSAVGNYIPISINSMLAENWNGKEWAVQELPKQKKAAAEGSGLSGVSCVSTSACTAVGYYRYFIGEFEHWHTLVEAWNGKEWAIQETPDVPERFSKLSSVSCTTTSSCIAVGSANTEGEPQRTLAESWNGTGWTIQKTPSLNEGKSAGELKSVSCTSSASCTAVGKINNGSELTLAESWNGTEWSLQETPNPAETKNDTLNGIWCPSSEKCVTVGQDKAGLIETSLSERLQ